MNSLAWYLNRLSKMPPQEIPYRINQEIKKRADRIKHKDFTYDFFNDPFALDLNNVFKLSMGIDPLVLRKEFPSEIAIIKKQADAVIENRLCIFDIEKSYGQNFNWHLDIKSGNRWPIKFWSDLNIKGDLTIGGPKFTWEVGRFLFMVPLGASYYITREEKYAHKLIFLFTDWMENNPYPFGIHWTSGIEIGIRLVNFIWALSFLREYEINEKIKHLINKFVSSHAYHLDRYPSLYSSSNNHALAEGFGLFMAGVFFPHVKNSDRWFFVGKKILEKEITRQILPDGGSFEHTTTYLSFVFDFFLLFMVVCEKFNLDYTKEIKTKLEKSCEFIYTLMDLNGHLPNIGDQDSAVLINFGQGNWNNFSSILNSGAILFNRPKLPLSFKPDLKTYLLTNFNVFPWGEKKDKKQIKSDYLKDSGLSIIRDTYKEKEVLFVGNATPLGMAPLYAHGHLDALSFTLFLGGKEIFTDPGTYLYHSGGKWRRYFRATSAHNTLRLNGLDFSQQIADFMYGRPYKITINTLENLSDRTRWIASHDAYQRKLKAKHIRQVDYLINEGCFVLNDYLSLKKTTLVELFFHLHPACQIIKKEKKIFIVRENVQLALQVDPKLVFETYRGCEDPILGWYSANFNHKQETTTLRLWGNFSGKQEFITYISVL